MTECISCHRSTNGPPAVGVDSSQVLYRRKLCKVVVGDEKYFYTINARKQSFK